MDNVKDLIVEWEKSSGLYPECQLKVLRVQNKTLYGKKGYLYTLDVYNNKTLVGQEIEDCFIPADVVSVLRKKGKHAG